MSTTTSGIAGGQSQTGATDKSGKLLFNDISADTFLKLMIAELQNQDPLSPMDNSQMVEQMNQIYQLQSNMKMVDSYAALTLSQNVYTASSLLGKTVSGLDDSSAAVTGRVDRVSIEDGVTKLHVGESVVSLKNVSEILPASD